MGKIPDRDMSRWSIAEANALIAKEFDKELWRLIVGRMDYEEIIFDRENEEIVAPDFIPFADLAMEVIAEMDPASIHRCQVCSQIFDINKEDGIFGDPTNLDHFLCQSCSESMSAKTFFNKHLVT